MKLTLTYEVVVTVESEEKGSQLETALEVKAKEFGTNVAVNEVDSEKEEDPDEHEAPDAVLPDDDEQAKE